MTVGQPVRVQWWDAHGGSASWVRLDEIDPEPCVVTSVGILLHHAKPGHLTLVQSIQGEHGDNVLHVPWGMVRSVVRL